MNRNDFGLWGIDLSPEDFRRALVAYGVWNWSKHSEYPVELKKQCRKRKANSLVEFYDYEVDPADGTEGLVVKL